MPVSVLPRISRRSLFGAGVAAFGVWPPPGRLRGAAAGEIKPRAKACILLYLDGGPSHLDLWDLKPRAPAEIRGPFQPISTSVAGTPLCEHLPLVARQMHRLVQIRSVRHQE